MIKSSLCVLALTLASQLSYASTTLIKNVKGYTLQDKELVTFTAIQFTDDKIDKLYSNSAPLPSNEKIKVIDGKGKTLLPGLIDAHGHVLSYGHSLLTVDLVNSSSEQESVERVVSYVKANSKISASEKESMSWIQGRGWNQVQWPSNEYPSAKSLDKYFPNTPIWLERIDGHAGWANSKAMELAGISHKTKTPSGGDIIRDQNGQPTGVFIDNAMSLILDKIAAPTKAEDKATLLKAMNSLASMGLTSVHDAGVDADNLSLYKELTLDKNMPIRINAMLYLPTPNWQTVLEDGVFKSQDDMLTFNSVKIQADGALGSRGAALIEDYSDLHGHRGLLLHNGPELNNFITTAMKLGFQVNTHAIGDNANQIVLDSYETHIKSSNTAHLRHRVEHAQVLRLKDIPRFEQLNVIASMQATHATSDKNMAQDRLGKERLLGAYAWRSLLNANAVIAAGSDFPVESPNPFFGLHASVTRQDHQNQPTGGWIESEKMTRLEAFNTFTQAAAYSGHQEKIIGSLAKGKKADFILTEDDPFTIEESNLWKNKVISTWVDGKNVFSAAH
ncbi:MAG: amidohydrolase [Colwellia sp.]